MPSKNVKGTKRASHDGGELPVKKTKVDPMIGAILEAVDMTQDISVSCKAMLAAMVPQALTVPLDERHSYQNTFVNIMEECMKTTEDGMMTAISKSDEHINSLSCNREALQKHVEDARKFRDVKTNIMNQQKAELAEHFRSVLEKRVLLSSAQQTHDATSAPIVDLRKKAEVCRQAISEDLAALREDPLTTHADTLCAKLVALSKSLGVEETLVASLPAVCAKQISDRGSFDVLVLDQFEKEVNLKASGIRMALEAKIASVVPLGQALGALQKELDEATAAHHLAAGALRAALAEEKVACSAHEECEVELMNFEPTLQAATEGLEEKRAALASFQTWNKASFDVLKVKPTPAPKTVALSNPESAPVGGEIPCQSSPA